MYPKEHEKFFDGGVQGLVQGEFNCQSNNVTYNQS